VKPADSIIDHALSSVSTHFSLERRQTKRTYSHQYSHDLSKSARLKCGINRIEELGKSGETDAYICSLGHVIVSTKFLIKNLCTDILNHLKTVTRKGSAGL